MCNTVIVSDLPGELLYSQSIFLCWSSALYFILYTIPTNYKLITMNSILVNSHNLLVIRAL